MYLREKLRLKKAIAVCDKLDRARRKPGRTDRTDLSRQHVVGGAKRNGQRFFTAALSEFRVFTLSIRKLPQKAQ